MLCRPTIALAVAAALAAPPAASAEDNPHLDRARQQKLSLDYTGARASLDAAVAWGKSSPQQMAAIYRLRGEIEAGLGDEDAAAEAFRKLLALEPEATLPDGTSPKIAAPFAIAQGYYDSAAPIEIGYAVERGAQPVLAVEVRSDPLEMVAGARVDYRTGGGWVASEARGRGTMRIALPRGNVLEMTVTAIDRHGNALVILGSRSRPLSVLTAASGETGAGERKAPIVGNWWVWGGAAVISGGLGIYFAVDMRDAQDELDAIYELGRGGDVEYAQYAERVEDLIDRGERDARGANISFAVAGATAIAATALLIRDLRRARRRERAAALVLARGGGTVVFSVSF